jgi:hypothetical protein
MQLLNLSSLVIKKKEEEKTEHKPDIYGSNIMNSAVVHAALAITSDKYLCGKIAFDEATVDDLLPAIAQDAYHFMDLTFAIRHPIFHLPTAITLGRYKYLLAEMIRHHRLPQLTCLDPSQSVETTRGLSLQTISQDILEAFDNLLIMTIETSATSLLKMELSARTDVSFSDDLLSVLISSHYRFSIVFRKFTIKTVGSEADRVSFLRMMASENTALPVRSMLLVTDLCYPLQIIPGIESKDHMITLALDRGDVSTSKW